MNIWIWGHKESLVCKYHYQNFAVVLKNVCFRLSDPDGERVSVYILDQRSRPLFFPWYKLKNTYTKSVGLQAVGEDIAENIFREGEWHPAGVKEGEGRLFPKEWDDK